MSDNRSKTAALLSKAEVKKVAKELKELTGKRLSECYEEIAKKVGYRDWNALIAMINKAEAESNLAKRDSTFNDEQSNGFPLF